MSTDGFDPSLLDYATRQPRLPPEEDRSNDRLDIPIARRLEIYELLLVLRQFEKRAYDLFMQNLVKGTSHLSLGMEGVAAGFGKAMRKDDFTFATYRGHAHTIARGAPLGPVMAELLGRENCLLKGKGGSMHLTSVAEEFVSRGPPGDGQLGIDCIWSQVRIIPLGGVPLDPVGHEWFRSPRG
jgi:TPP-dependent pyruvate/acetoin dehydrogenase alpha subunit